MQRSSVLIEITQGNLNHAHFYLCTARHLFDSDVIGAANQHDGLGSVVAVTYAGDSEPCETDIAGEQKMFFRRRGPIRAFFARHRLLAGDLITVTRTGTRSYTVAPPQPSALR